MRSRFDEQLEKLNAELITMGALCEQAITIAINALVYGNDDDKAQFNKVHETEREIDQKERDIENLCMKLLLQQQPVASDLRKISSALKMISDMERIGDQASDISDITMHIRFENLKSKVHISDMAAAAIKMVTDSINSFVKKDLELVKAVAAYDDVVDRLFIKVKDELLELIKDGDVSCLDLLMIAKYLERIGDHAVNIAEWVEYSITGQKLL
ncbi:MAG: phosphate signaling complex protein PhoU [Clostridiales bacterium]|jgi:phosphate transport system regulatory protein phoU|nr:phosphate signaling complex protein PhoU [Clostridiales bacterium]